MWKITARSSMVPDSNENSVYADNNATSPLAPEVWEEMRAWFGAAFHNASALYGPARNAARAIGHAREQVADLLGLQDSRVVVFTSGATESNNAALFGAARGNPARRHVLTTSVEHPSVVSPCAELEREGYAVTYLPVDSNGALDAAHLQDALRPDTLLVSIMHANNETGIQFPVGDLARLVKEFDARILIHTDATQSVGKLPIRFEKELDHIDFLSMSAHKLHGPKGSGALVIREGAPWRSFMLGGHQEGGRRGGTYNVPGIVGLGRACELANQYLDTHEQASRLCDEVQAYILGHIPGVGVNGANSPRLPNTLSVSFEGIEGEGLVHQLSATGVYISTGSACTSGSTEPSYVLRAMGVPEPFIHGSVRISFSRYTTAEEAERLCEALAVSVDKLRRLSPKKRGVQGTPDVLPISVRTGSKGDIA